MRTFKLFFVALICIGIGACKKDEPGTNNDPDVKAQFTLPTQNLYVSCPIKMTNTTTGANTYEWDFGDGNKSTEENPEHKYTKEGSYIIKLKASNASKSSETTQTIKIEALPPITSSFTFPVGANAQGAEITFTNTSIGAVKNEWTFGDGGTSSEVSPKYKFNTVGTFEVKLMTTNVKGNTAESKQNVVIAANLAADFTIPAGTLYNGCEVMFTNTSVGATSYQWTFGDGGTSTEASPSHAYKEPGIYTVRLIVSNASGNKEMSKNISISSPQTFNNFYQNGIMDDRGVAIFGTDDGGYVVFNKERDDAGKKEGFIFSKFDKNNNRTTRTKFLGSKEDWLETVVEVNDGYLCGYSSFNNNNGTMDFAIMKLSKSGAQLDNKIYPRTSKFDQIRGIIKTKNNGYVLVGFSANTLEVDGSTRGYAVWIDNNLNYRFDKEIMGTYSYALFNKGVEDKNENLVIVGREGQNFYMNDNNLNGHVFVLNKNGVYINQSMLQNYGVDDRFDELNDIAYDAVTNSFYVCGKFKKLQSLFGILNLKWRVMKIDPYNSFPIIWQREDETTSKQSAFDRIEFYKNQLILSGFSNISSNDVYSHGLLGIADDNGSHKEYYYRGDGKNTYLGAIGFSKTDCSMLFAGFTDAAHFADPDLFVVKTDYRGKGN